MHIAKYSKHMLRPQLVVFDKATRVLDWCRKHDALYAINGGFFCRQYIRPLGEVCLNGEALPFTPFAKQWVNIRGALHIDEKGEIEIASRNGLRNINVVNLLQAGPLLVSNGRNMINDGSDSEGFSETSHQFDADIVNGRFPRAAIGTSQDSIICMVADGYSKRSPGLTMNELAQLMVHAGAESALNLDGGASSSLIYNGQLINTSRTMAYVNKMPTSKAYNYPLGRPVHSAIIFHQK